MDIKLLMLFALIAASAALNSQWQLTSQDNKIYSGDIKFQKTLTQSWECAKACTKYDGYCSAFGFVPSTGICYGYGKTSNPEYVTGAQLWSRMCSLPGYIMEPALGKCIKFNTNKLGWTNASIACQADGASLLRLDKQEPVFDWRLYDSSSYRSWIGGYDVGENGNSDWRWNNGVPVNASHWYPGQPNDEADKCIYLQLGLYGLWDYKCNITMTFICQEF